MSPYRPRVFFWFYLAKVFANLGAFAFLPFLPLYLTDRQAGIMQVGIFFSALAVARLAFGLLGGWLADTVGHLRGLALGSAFGVGAFAVLLWAPAWGWVYAGMVLIQAASALTTPAQSAFIGGYAQGKRGKAFGLMNTIHTAAQMGGPALGGWLVEGYGFQVLFLVAGLLYTAAAGIRFVLSRQTASPAENDPAPRPSLAESLRGMKALVAGGGLLAWMLLADGLGDITFSLTETYQPIFLEAAGLPIFRIGLIGTLAYAATLASHSIAGWLVDRYGEKLPVTLSFALTGASILVFVGSSSFIGFAVGWALMGLMWGLGTTAYDSLISKAVPAGRRGLAYGMFSTANGFFSLPVPLIGGWLYLWGPAAPFVAAAGASILGAALVLRKFPAGRVEEEGAGVAELAKA
ncbi:MAG TPA: MFS transporter [Anaerolineales bacterium]|nr:MFS transporter [Anaerolineales bacterium]